MQFGVDVSRHQADYAIKNLNDKAKFVIIRSSFGTYTKDSKFDRFIQDAIDKGLHIGIYVASYASNVTEAIQEAEFAIKCITPYKEHIDLPIYFDFEYFSSSYIANKGIATTPELVQLLTTAFCDTIIKAGYKAGFYSNLDYIKRFYTQAYINNHQDYSFWYARPGLPNPDKICDIWQYASNSGVEYGYKGNIDQNIMFKDLVVDDDDEIPPQNDLQKEIDRLNKKLNDIQIILNEEK